MRVAYEPCESGSKRLNKNFPLPAAEAYTLEYWLFLEEGWESRMGGKLHGLGPANSVSGCRPGAPDKWSSRIMWFKGNLANNYIYVQNREKNCGDNLMDGKFAIPIGEWVRMTLYVKVNTPGQADGISETYVNGTKIFSSHNLKLRGSVPANKALIEKFMFSTFFGGGTPQWAPTKTVYARFDNFTVSKGKTDPSVPVTPVSGAGATTPTSAFLGEGPENNSVKGISCKTAPAATAGKPFDKAVPAPAEGEDQTSVGEAPGNGADTPQSTPVPAPEAPGNACICPVAEALAAE